MLDMAGNLLEKFVRTRLPTTIRTAGDVHEKQFCFRLGRLAVDTIQELCEAVRREEDYNHFSIRTAGGVHEKQFCFRLGRSAVDTIQELWEAVRREEAHNHFLRRVELLVTLDVKNVFNFVRWSDMLKALGHDFCVPRYLLQMVDNHLMSEDARRIMFSGVCR